MTHRVGRGTWPRRCRALVQSCRATAGIPHRTVRDRPLAPLITPKSHSSKISRKPRARSKPGAICRRARPRPTIPPSICPGSGHIKRHRARARGRAISLIGCRRRRWRSRRAVGAGCLDVSGTRACCFGRGTVGAGDGRANPGRWSRTDAGRDRATLSAAAQRAVARGASQTIPLWSSLADWGALRRQRRCRICWRGCACVRCRC